MTSEQKPRSLVALFSSLDAVPVLEPVAVYTTVESPSDDELNKIGALAETLFAERTPGEIGGDERFVYFMKDVDDRWLYRLREDDPDEGPVVSDWVSADTIEDAIADIKEQWSLDRTEFAIVSDDPDLPLRLDEFVQDLAKAMRINPREIKLKSVESPRLSQKIDFKPRPE